MDQKQFDEFIEQTLEPKPRAGRRGNEIIDNNANIRWRLKKAEYPCPDCGQQIATRQIQYKIVRITDGTRFQKKCSDCGLYLGRSEKIE